MDGIQRERLEMENENENVNDRIFNIKFKCFWLCLAFCSIFTMIVYFSAEITQVARGLHSKMFPQKSVTTILKYDPNEIIRINGKLDMIRKDIAACFANDQILKNQIDLYIADANSVAE